MKSDFGGWLAKKLSKKVPEGGCPVVRLGLLRAGEQGFSPPADWKQGPLLLPCGLADFGWKLAEAPS